MIRPRQRGSSRALLLALLALAGVAAASLVIWRARGHAKIDAALPPPSSSGAAPATGAGAGPGQAGRAHSAPPGAGIARDYRRDREMTSSAEAYKVYAEGVGLLRRLPVQAAARFRKAVTLDPSFAPAHYRLAMAATLASHGAEARSAIRSAVGNQERLPEPYRTASSALSSFAEGAFDLARLALDDALSAHPDDPDLHYIAGMLHSCSCDYFDPNAVIEHFEQAVAVDPDFPAARARLMEAYEMKGMRDWSLARAMEHQSRHPDRPDAIAEAARARIARGEYGDAIEAADEIVRQGGDVLGHGLAPAFILSDQHALVAAMYDPEMERTSSLEANVLTHLHAGINDVWMGRFDRARHHFERGPEFLPAPWEKSRRALFLLLLGRAHGLQGRYREAGAALQAALDVGGPEGVLEYAYGMNLLGQGDTAQAGRVVYRLSQERHRSRPGWTEPWRLLMAGEMALAKGEAAVAIDQVRAAWSLQKPLAIDCIVGHPDAYFLDALGRAYLAAGRPQEALDAFEQIRGLRIRALHQPEVSALALYRSGLALESLDRRDAAAARYRQFLRLWGSAADPPREAEEARKRLGAMGGNN